MKRHAFIAAVLVLSTCAFIFAGQDDSLTQLMTKADAASGAQRANLCMQVADRELRLTLDSYKQNRPDEARSSLRQIVHYSDQAHAAAIQSGKKLKHTEIRIRQISEHLRDLKYNTDVDDQPIIQAAIDKLEGFRTELLKSMFGGAKNND
jgi:hypothetical protein